MEEADPDTLIAEAQAEREQQASDAPTAFGWFKERYDDGGGLVARDDAAIAIAEENGWEEGRARDALRGLTADVLDPVQLVRRGGERYVGIIDYRVFEAEGGYGFEEYDDVFGRRKNMVCGKCVEDYDYDREPWRAVEGEGRHDGGCDWGSLLDHLTEHYTQEHSTAPSSVDVAAALVSGTTIASNTAIHLGNDGSGSGLDADTVDGQDSSALGGKGNGGGFGYTTIVDFTTYTETRTDGTTSTTVTEYINGNNFDLYGQYGIRIVAGGQAQNVTAVTLDFTATCKLYNQGSFLNSVTTSTTANINTGNPTDRIYSTSFTAFYDDRDISLPLGNNLTVVATLYASVTGAAGNARASATANWYWPTPGLVTQ